MTKMAWVQEQLEIARQMEEFTMKLQALAAKYDGVAFAIHDTVEVEVPWWNIEAFLSELKQLKEQGQ